MYVNIFSTFSYCSSSSKYTSTSYHRIWLKLFYRQLQGLFYNNFLKKTPVFLEFAKLWIKIQGRRSSWYTITLVLGEIQKITKRALAQGCIKLAYREDLYSERPSLLFNYSNHLNTKHLKSKHLTFRTLCCLVFKWSDHVIWWLWVYHKCRWECALVSLL